MGHAIERIAIERGHDIVAVIDADNTDCFDSEAFASADVAIEFTTPSTAEATCRRSMERGVAVVSGSTGWTDRLPELIELCEKGKGTMMWSSNYSLGVNLFFALNSYLAALTAPFSQYVPSMKEIHHIHKLDHPSGTAISLAQGIITHNPRVDAWSENTTATAADGSLVMGISHEREGEVPGTHIVDWDSPVDTITIEHRAKSRDGFALGAVVAAEWMKGRKGYHTIDEMIRSMLSRPELLDILK